MVFKLLEYLGVNSLYERGRYIIRKRLLMRRETNGKDESKG